MIPENMIASTQVGSAVHAFTLFGEIEADEAGGDAVGPGVAECNDSNFELGAAQSPKSGWHPVSQSDRTCS